MEALSIFERNRRREVAPVAISASALPGFDADFYIAQNPEIARAGLDPLDHFMTKGWREGRDPSASFSTEGYLRANPEVEKRDINPLVHFLQEGLARGCIGWQINSVPSRPMLDADAAQSLVAQIYRTIAQRAPSDQTIEYYVQRLSEGEACLLELAREAVSHREVQDQAISLNKAVRDLGLRSKTRSVAAIEADEPHDVSERESRRFHQPRPISSSEISTFPVLPTGPDKKTVPSARATPEAPLPSRLIESSISRRREIQRVLNQARGQ